MDLYSILVCPVCKGDLTRQEASLTCPSCQRVYPLVNGVPVLLPEATIPSSTEYQHQLTVRADYDPWIPRLVLQSLAARSIILEIGAGNLALNLPNVIRLDVTLTPYVDVVADAHALPFRPNTFDFVFSLAVIEHLRQPFLAAEEMFNVLRNGGYVYGDCCFVFAYHGYPHHYFNASEQGLEQVFGQFEKLRTGVAPYQMPSFAIFMLLSTYLYHMIPSDDPEVSEYRHVLQQILDQPLRKYDGLFTEHAALNVAAGVFYFGRKSLQAPVEVIPPVLQELWEREPELQQLFPELYNLGTTKNIMLWAKQEGRQQYEAIADFFRDLTPFRKSDTVGEDGERVFAALPIAEPAFHTILDTRVGTLVRKKEAEERLAHQAEMLLAVEVQQRLAQEVETLAAMVAAKNEHIAYLESLIKQIEAGRVMRVLRSLGPRKE